MGLQPTFGRLDSDEAQALLYGLYYVDRIQLRKGVPGILGRLLPNADPLSGKRILVYQRGDPAEQWRTIRDIHRAGGGDCEDLATAGAAELSELGIPALPYVYRVNPRLSHVVIRRLDTGELLDPSKLGGMGETPLGGYEVSSGCGMSPEQLGAVVDVVRRLRWGCRT